MKQKTKNKDLCIFPIAVFVVINYLIIGVGHVSLYEPDVYVCRHMARDIEDYLELLRIPVTLIRASNHNNSEAHMWVRVCGIEFDSVCLLPYYSFTYTENRTEFNDYQDFLDWK